MNDCAKAVRYVFMPLGLLVAAVASTAGTFAAELECGAVVTQSVKLDADMTCSTYPGLIIGASEVTVDLNGHRIDGTSVPVGNGIRISGPSGAERNVRITNGTIVGFGGGISIASAEGVRIEHVVIRSPAVNGIQVADSSNVKITNVHIVGAPFYEASGRGIRLLRASDVDVENVYVDGFVAGVAFDCPSCVGTPNSGNVKFSTFKNNYFGIYMSFASNLTIVGNHFLAPGGLGIGGGWSTEVLVANNAVFGGRDAAGVPFTAAAMDVVYLTNSTITGNTMLDAAGEGIGLEEGCSGNTVKSNIALGNGADVEDASGLRNVWKQNICNFSGTPDVVSCPLTQY